MRPCTEQLISKPHFPHLPSEGAGPDASFGVNHCKYSTKTHTRLDFGSVCRLLLSLLGGLCAHGHPGRKARMSATFFFFLCSLYSYSNCIETLFFYPSFFQNAPMNFTDLLDEECLRNWRPAFPKMEKTDGRQAPWYSLV